jgi:hypothetical protein
VSAPNRLVVSAADILAAAGEKQPRPSRPGVTAPFAAPAGPPTRVLGRMEQDPPATAPDEVPAPPADLPTIAVELDSIESLLTRSQSHERARVRALGMKIVGLVAELREHMKVDRAQQEASERVAQARNELDAAVAALKALQNRKAPTAAKPAAPAAVDYRAVRAWAYAEGIDCPVAGRVASHIVERWRKATAGGGATGPSAAATMVDDLAAKAARS